MFPQREEDKKSDRPQDCSVFCGFAKDLKSKLPKKEKIYVKVEV